MSTLKWVGGTGGNETNPATAGNWSTGSAPVSGDDVFIENPTGTTYSIATNLQGLAAVYLHSLNIAQNYTGNIGTGAIGSTGYFGISSSLTSIGYSTGGTAVPTGSGMLRINFGTAQHNTTVYNTSASSSLSNGGPVTILGSHSNNTLSVLGGTVSVAIDPTEVANLITVNNAGNLTLGSGVTLTTMNLNGGSTTEQSAVTTINQYAGNLTTAGTGAITTITQAGGTAFLNSTGTITNLTFFGAVDFSRNTASRIVTNATMNGPTASINLNNGVRNSVVLTNSLTTRGAVNFANIRQVPTITVAFS